MSGLVLLPDIRSGGALITADGSIDWQSGVVERVVKNGTGDYTIHFNGPIGDGYAIEVQTVEASADNIGSSVEIVSTTEIRVRFVVEG